MTLDSRAEACAYCRQRMAEIGRLSCGECQAYVVDLLAFGDEIDRAYGFQLGQSALVRRNALYRDVSQFNWSRAGRAA